MLVPDTERIRTEHFQNKTGSGLEKLKSPHTLGELLEVAV